MELILFVIAIHRRYIFGLTLAKINPVYPVKYFFVLELLFSCSLSFQRFVSRPLFNVIAASFTGCYTKHELAFGFFKCLVFIIRFILFSSTVGCRHIKDK